MSTYVSKWLARYYLRTVTRRFGYIWLVLFLIMGLGMADMVQYAGLAEGASTATATVAASATGAISGKILDQSGNPLNNIQVLALNQSTITTSGGIYYSPSLPYSLSIYPPWTPEGLSTSYGASGYGYSIYGTTPYGSYSYSNGSVSSSSLYQALNKADGTFLLSNLPEGRYSLWAYDAQGRGYVPVILGLDSSAEGQLLGYYPSSSQNIMIKVKSGQTAGPFNVVMNMGGKLSGRLTDADTGLPIKGAIIQTSLQNPAGYVLPLLTSSDASGNFTFSGLPEGKVMVNVSEAEGYITNPGAYYPSFEENTYSVVAGQETSGCKLALKRSATVSGKVTSQADGKAVAGAEITCFMTAGEDVYSGYYRSFSAISAADGTYLISGLDTGTYVPMASRAPGFQGAYYPNTQDQSQAKEIHVELGKGTASINFQLLPSKTNKGKISGQIIDKKSGLPLAGIQVSLSQVYVSAPYSSYPVYGYPPYGGGLLMRNRDEAVASDSASSGASGALNTYATTAAYATTASAPTPYATTASAPVAPSVSALSAAPPVPGDTVVAPATMPTTFVSYASPAYYPVSIPTEPSSSSGSYLPSLSDVGYVYIDPVWTDQEGRFEFTGLELGNYSLNAYDPAGWYLYGYYPEYNSSTGYTTPSYIELSETQPVSGDIEIPLRRGGHLEGKVMAGSTPLAGMQVMVIKTSQDGQDDITYGYPAAYYNYGARTSDTTDTSGEFTICGLEEGEYVLLAGNYSASQNYMTTFCIDTNAQGEKPRVFTITEGSSVTNLVISMNTGASITGKIMDKSGKPLAGIVVLTDLERDYNSDDVNLYSIYMPSRFAITADDGTYTVTGLSEGAYTLSTMNSYADYQRGCCSGITVTPPAMVFAPDLILAKSMVISGRVTSQDGQPLASITVNASFDYSSAPRSDNDQSGSSCSVGVRSSGSATTAEDGTYRITSLSAGSYYLDVYDQTGEYVSGQRSPNGEYLSGPLNAGSALGVITGAEGEVKTNMDLQLVKSGTIKGTIRDAATGQPVSGLTVTAQMEPANDPYATSLYGTSGNPGPYDYYGTSTPNPYANYRGMPEVNGEEAQPDGQGVVDSASTAEPVRTADPMSSAVMFAPPGTTDAPVPPPTATVIGYYPGSYPGYGSGQYSSSASDSQGNYKLSGLPAGKYILSITDTAGKNYMPQYYPGVSSADKATSFEINTAQTMENIDFNLDKGIIFTGTLKDMVTGQPIIGSGIMVTLTNEQGAGVKQAYTDSFGKYKFTGIRPGTYSIHVGESQYYHDGCYLKIVDYQQATIPTITLSLPGPVEGIDILLQPKASISGRVVDEYDQKPLPNITITAMSGYPGAKESATGSSGSAVGSSALSLYDPYSSIMPYSSSYSSYRYYQAATTDGDGRYTLKGLGEGSYMIMATDYSHIYAGEYYKDVPANQMEKANVITVGRSENKGGIDLALKVGETYTGRDTTPSTVVSYYSPSPYPYYASSSNYGGYGSSTYASLASSGVSYSAYGTVAPLTIVEGDRTAQAYDSGLYGSSGLGGLPSTVSTQPGTTGIIPAPEIISSNSVENITAGRTFTYQVKVNEEAANTPLKYSLTHAPEGMNIDPDSGVVQWKPSNSDAGQAIVQLKVDNGSGQVALEAFRLGVEEDTTPPEEISALTAAKGDRKVTISWKPSANSDGDQADQILYVKEGNAPYGAGISLGKATTNYTVENLQNAKAYTFKITTSDELANESNGVTAAATPAKAQAANTVVNQQSSWYTPAALWNVGSSSPWSSTGLGTWPSSSWTSSLWSNNTSTLGLWNAFPVTSLWGNYSTTSSTGIFGTNSLWNSSLGFSNSLTDQNYRMRSSQSWWNLTF